MKRLKKSTSISAVELVSGLVGGCEFFLESDLGQVDNLRKNMTTWYKGEYKPAHESGEDTEKAVSFDANSDEFHMAFAEYMIAKERYDSMFAERANRLAQSNLAISEAISKLSGNTAYAWFNVDYLSSHGYSFEPKSLCITDKQVISYVAKLYATALSDKQHVNEVESTVREYMERITNRVNQMKSWNVKITSEIISGMLVEYLSNETDKDVIGNVTERANKLLD